MTDKLREALEKIAADSPPDDWETYGPLDGYLGYKGIVRDVDESNSGDVHDHGFAVGKWSAAKIARKALAATADAPPTEPTEEMVETMFDRLSGLVHAWDTSPVSVRFHIREALQAALTARKERL